MRRKGMLLSIDLLWVVIATFIALLLRTNFEPPLWAVAGASAYSLISVIVAAIILPIAGVNRGLWRYTSLRDLLRMIVAATLVVLVAQFIDFAVTRSEDIARSLPVIQWLVMVALMGGTRVGIRIWQQRRDQPAKQAYLGPEDHRHVLVVGVSQLTEMYLRAVAEFAPHSVSVIGILASGQAMQGRLLQSYRVLGQPENLEQVVQQLEVHGELPDRILVAIPPARLSREALDALFKLERSSTIKVDWMSEMFGLGAGEGRNGARSENPEMSKIAPLETAPAVARTYCLAKRAIDFIGAIVLLCALSPLILVATLLTAIDVGFPLGFWQKRPGRFGYAFKLYKFRTMTGTHDADGNRVPDEQRLSAIGAWLRRTRLDELPQLYNILVGEMSFIGPRPLLPTDQGPARQLRLLLRPGLSGWAQVNGGRLLSAEDKAALDVWYLHNMSFGLDLRIAIRTFRVLIAGEQLNQDSIELARNALYTLGTGCPLEGESGPERLGAAEPDVTLVGLAG